MADKTLKILCVHGLNHQSLSDWDKRWPEAIRGVFPQTEGLSLDFRFITYDDIFERTKIGWDDLLLATGKLAASGIASLFRRQRGIGSAFSDRVRWTAGYVVAWVGDPEFQRRSRQRILDAVREHQPDVILAHSLGSLITYNAFSHPDAREDAVAAVLGKARYVTFGSQINNPFVIGSLTNGRVQAIDVGFWYHLFNVHDDIFTAPIQVWDMPNFRQIDTPFDDPGVGDHSAERYFTRRPTIDNLWRQIAAWAIEGREPVARSFAARPAAAPRRRVRKALLVGINEYPDPANRLEGCVNDAFTMSALLQDCGFDPEAIRLCLDDRATTEGILSRLKWLLDDPRPGDELVFYYSGHGAQMPEYGDHFEPDHKIECLVPWDFNWSPETAVSDYQIHDLYAQLPYDTRLALIFDCCQSGDMHRLGGNRPRGLTPPDDIRHRALKWDRKTGMWVPRDFRRINQGFTSEPDVAERYFGKDGATYRIGRSGMLRALSAPQYARLKKQEGDRALGPYLPLIIEACREEQQSYEYRHGASSHGAFTFSLDKILRREKKISFKKLIDKVRDQLAELSYDQEPQILGPTEILKHQVPWTGV